MKALVVGCGSIGRRHINNLCESNKIESVAVYTKLKDCPREIIDLNRKVIFLKNLDGVQADFAVICNETNKHIETAVKLAQKGINLFIEKPLSCNSDGVKELNKIVSQKKIKLTVGYNLRFLPAMEYVKRQLLKGVLGDLYFARIEVGQFLPDWRRNINYKDSYSACRAKGGGVALDLSHEVDYMRYLFGDPVGKKIAKAKVSRLEIDCEDVFEGLYLFKNNFICNVHMDYLQRTAKREIRIVASKGSLTCDFVKGVIVLAYCGKESVIKDKKLFDMDKTYKDEMSDFLKAIGNNTAPRVGLDDGLKVLKLLEEEDV